jgi:hypothetical protein
MHTDIWWEYLLERGDPESQGWDGSKKIRLDIREIVSDTEVDWTGSESCPLDRLRFWNVLYNKDWAKNPPRRYWSCSLIFSLPGLSPVLTLAHKLSSYGQFQGATVRCTPSISFAVAVFQNMIYSISQRLCTSSLRMLSRKVTRTIYLRNFISDVSTIARILAPISQSTHSIRSSHPGGSRFDGMDRRFVYCGFSWHGWAHSWSATRKRLLPENKVLMQASVWQRTAPKLTSIQNK